MGTERNPILGDSLLGDRTGSASSMGDLAPTSEVVRALDLKPCLRGMETLDSESFDCRGLVALRRDFDGILSYVGGKQAPVGFEAGRLKVCINPKLSVGASKTD